jgi:hypothetical protein
MRALRSSFVLAVLLVFSGCNLPPAAVWLHVDNTGEETLTVTVDGKQLTKIKPGQSGPIKCPPGERKIVVKRSGEVFYEGTHDLKKSEKFGATRKYVLDPHGANHYAIFSAQYGSNPFQGMLQTAALKAGKSKVSKEQIAYKELLKLVKELPPARIVDAEYTDYVLKDPPESVHTRYGSTAERSVMTRIDPKDHAYLRGARQLKNPTRQEVEELADVIKRIVFATQEDE